MPMTRCKHDVPRFQRARGGLLLGLFLLCASPIPAALAAMPWHLSGKAPALHASRATHWDDARDDAASAEGWRQSRRHLLFQQAMLDETPKARMERMRRELRLQQAAAAEAAAAESHKAAQAKKEAKKAKRKHAFSEEQPRALAAVPTQQSAAAAQEAKPALAAPAGALVERQQLQGCKLKMYGGKSVAHGKIKEHYGSWTLCANGIHKGNIVYSFGTGTDVSFDLDLVRKGCRVYAFDPTKTEQYVRNVFKKHHDLDDFPHKFRFFQVGIGVTDATLPFFRSADPKVGSTSAVPLDQLRNYKDVGLHAKVQALGSIRRQLKHHWVDVLKLDAEGVELELCESRLFLRNLARVTQVAIEFHDRMVLRGKRRKLRCIEKIRSLGFTVVHHAANFREVTFARLRPT